MKIYFTGSHGTGKSSLVERLNIDGFKKFDSMSKIFLKPEEQQIQIEFGSKKWFDFQRKIALYCLNIYTNETNFISSRSIFDSLAYTKGKSKFLYDLALYYEDLLFDKDTYYFYIPIEFPLSNNGNELRITDLSYQSEIDKVILSEFHRASKQFKETGAVFEIITGSIDERLSKIETILKLNK